MINDKFASLIKTANDAINDQEKILVCSLNFKLTSALKDIPHDQTIRALSHIVSKLEDNGRLFMSRGELKDLYKKTYTNHTKFAEIFSSELGEMEGLKSPTYAKAEASKGQELKLAGTDEVLANALQSVFDRSIPLKMYTQEMAEKAKAAVSNNLDRWNLNPSNLDVQSGNEHFIAVRADYETPKGKTSILVPVEVRGNKALQPSLFMGNKDPQELNHISIKAYLTSQAGKALKVRAADMIAAISSAVIKTASEVSSVELALTKLNSSREVSTPFFAGSIIGQKQDEEAKPDVSIPKGRDFESFAAKFETPLGYAQLTHGANKIGLARDVISRELLGFGLKNAQINLSGADETTLIYAVSINDGRVAFNVPVKFANNRLLNPEMMICNGEVSQFSKAGVQKLMMRNEKDFTALAACSAQYGMKPSELINSVSQAMADGNYKRAEDALNILASNEETKEAYKTAFQIFSSGLTKQASSGEKEEKSRCSLVVKNASSEHQLCGHTNLPLHKVFQDEHGNCHPLYRKNMEANYEGMTFMNSKIFG